MSYKIKLPKSDKGMAKNWFAFLREKREYEFARAIKDKKRMEKADKKAKYYLGKVVDIAQKKLKKEK